MTQFNPGDKVVFITDYNDILAGEEAVVIEQESSILDHKTLVRVKFKNNHKMTCFLKRVKLVEKFNKEFNHPLTKIFI